MIITDLETWLIDYHDQKIFRVWKKKTTFTPYEINEKFVDEQTSEFFIEGMLVECIELPDKDLLLGFRSQWEDVEDGMYITKCSDIIDYIKLSDIESMSDISEVSDG